MNVTLYIHQGLGDAIICNSLVRHYCKNNKNVTLFCKVPYYESVNYLFRDIENITVLPINEDQIENYIQNNKNNFDAHIKIGFHNLNSYEEFDTQMYRQADIPHNDRWFKFTFKRNHEAEKVIYNNLIKNNEPYIFLHEDVSRGFIINRAFIKNKNIRVIEPTYPTDNIFLYAKIIENAQEVHCIDSSFLNFTEHLQTQGELFYHKYARPPHCSHSPTVRSKWNILDKNTTHGDIALLTHHTKMIDLQNITLVTINCLPEQQTKATKMLDFCLKGCTFKEVKFFTSEDIRSTNTIEVVRIPKIDNISKYNDFMLYELNRYINTDFCLVTQINGFIINPHLWDDIFLTYDYIGAPWFDYGWDRTIRIGNGGFSLRSKKLLQACTTWKKENIDEPEDVFISKKLDEHNLKYPDPITAQRFSIEWPGIPDNNWVFDIKKSFGFHSETIYNRLYILYPELFNK